MHTIENPVYFNKETATTASLCIDDINARDLESVDINIPSDLNVNNGPTQRKHVRTYAQRWYVLGIFSTYVTLQYFIWNTFGPIASSVKKVFDWQNSDVATLANWDTILYVAFAMQFCWLVQEKGLRRMFLVSLFFVTAGGIVRCIAVEEYEYSKWLMNTGQILNGFGGVLAQASGPFISNTWFPPTERTRATAIATLTAQFGLALSYIIGPIVVRDLPSSAIQLSDKNVSINNGSHSYHNNVILMKEDISSLMYSEVGVAFLLLLVALGYFPNKPMLPPSTSASLPRLDFRGGFFQLVYKRHFWLILIITSSVTGIYSGWGAVLYVNLKGNHLDITQTQCGWIGFSTTILCVAGGVVLGYVSDRFPGHIRIFLLICFTTASVSFTYIALVCQHVLHYRSGLLYVACLIGGFCINGSIPLMYEVTIELTYPVPETVSIGFLGVANNIFTFIFLLLLNVPGIGVLWMNWCLVATCLVSLCLLVLFRERYGRMEVDGPSLLLRYISNENVLTL